jgi:hypothetical protein
LATTVVDTEDYGLEDLGVIKSSYKITKRMCDAIKNNLLLETETVNKNPASFMNLFLEEWGRSGAISFYEQMMYKNELWPSTAIKLRSLINRMNDQTLAEIYAKPANMQFVLGFLKQEILNNAVGNYAQKKLIINKDTEFNINGIGGIFRLDHNIEIIITNPGSEDQNIYAMYDISDKVEGSNLSAVSNPLISYQLYKLNNREYFLMYINVRQYERKIFEYEVLNEDADFIYSYSNQLFGFEVAHKGNSNLVYRHLIGKPDGNMNMNGYNFYINNDDKKIFFNFNKNKTYFTPSVGDKIRITVYTTLGKSGNFTIPNIFEQNEKDLGLNIKFNQNRNNIMEDKVLLMTPYLSLKSGEITGGADMMSITQIKNHVITRGTNNNIMTPSTLERIAKSNYNITMEKTRDDIRSLEFKGSGVLRDIENNVYMSSIFDFDFAINDIPLNVETNARYFKSKSIYKISKDNNKKVEFVKNPTSFSAYCDTQKISRELSDSEFCFPFLLKVETMDTIKTNIYDMNRLDVSYDLNFEFFNTKTSDELSILSLILYRNTMTETLDNLPGGAIGNPRSTGYFILQCKVATSENVIQSLKNNPNSDKPFVKFRFKIFNRYTSLQYILDSEVYSIDEENKSLTIRAYLKTDDCVDRNDRILIRDYSLVPYPYVPNNIEYYFIDKDIDIELYCMQRNLRHELINTSYDRVLTADERSDYYFISTVYSIENVSLFDNYSSNFNLLTDLRMNQPIYDQYNEDAYEMYTENVYDYNEDGTVKTEIKEVTIGQEKIEVPFQIILHKKGDYKLDANGNRIKEYSKGDYIINPATGKPVIKTKESYNVNIKKIPFYDRIYSYGDNYISVYNSFKSLINRMDSLKSSTPDGVSLYASILNSIGEGDWEIYNNTHRSWEPIDSILLSFSIGVKYSDNMGSSTSNQSNNNRIVTIIDDYIKNFNEISFSIDNIFDAIKDQIPVVSYLVLYGINNYSADEVQAIRKKGENELNKDILSVRRIIDESKSDLNEGIIIFKPDITVREIE